MFVNNDSAEIHKLIRIVKSVAVVFPVFLSSVLCRLLREVDVRAVFSAVLD